MRTLLDDGWERIAKGVTTFQEVLKVARESEFLSELESAEGETARAETQDATV